MTQPAKAQEPSMEEILASIRRIIADDDAGKAARAPEPPAPKPAPPPVAVVASRPTPPPPPPEPEPDSVEEDVEAMVAEIEAEPQAVAAPPASPVPPAPDVLDLTEAMAAPPPPPAGPGFRTIDGASDVVFADRVPEPAVRFVEEPQPAASAMAEGTLLSASTRAAVDSAFHSLAHTVLGQNARTLEDLVKEMLRPMLKTWLDDNLPSMVERIVRAEIERVSRGR